MTLFFVTSSGTEIGKTFISTLLIEQFRARGRSVSAIKPVASGVTNDTLEKSDTGLLLRALGRPVNVTEADRISPWRFAAPLSPDMAAAREGRSICFDDLIAFSRRNGLRSFDALVIEGVGGLMAPLGEAHTVLDWMIALSGEMDARFLLVVGSYLGSISHSLTAVATMRAQDLVPAAVIVSQSLEEPVELRETVATLHRFLPEIPIHSVPRIGTPLQCIPDLTAWEPLSLGLPRGP